MLVIELTGPTGNAFYILGAARKAWREAGVDEGTVESYVEEATSGDYENLLEVVKRRLDEHEIEYMIVD